MRPALQRLVANPSSRELLRLLVGNEGAARCYAPANLELRRKRRKGLCLMGYSGVAVAARENDGVELQEEEGLGGERAGFNTSRERLHPRMAVRTRGKVEKQTTLARPSLPTAQVVAIPKRGKDPWADAVSSTREEPMQMVPDGRVEWQETMFTHERLDFESNLTAMSNGGRERLLDTTYKNDMRLWAMLLGYRQRIYGMEGVLTFWNAIREGKIQLSSKGFVADKLWPTFLALGMEKPEVLEEIYRYAKKHGLHASVYAWIVGNFLETHDGAAALKWHNRLSEIQQPNQITFAKMCRRVIVKSGDLGTMKQIYNMLPHRNIYHKIIPLLCKTENFKLAIEWHTLLCKHGDYPTSAKYAESLVQYLATYDPPVARKITQDLVKSGASFASTLSQKLEDSFIISRELMNVIHGETMHIPVKKYNDELGARWFATTWVSLDVAINAVHALGVQEIGPLSLQAIALRDTEPRAIIARIEHLKELNISTGTSLFSRAVKTFARHARHGKLDLLDGLLNSDQHPDELENFELQEALLTSYAQDGNWPEYRRTLEIRLLASSSPEIDKRNIELRMIASTSGASAALRGLEDMLLDRIPVKSQTISTLLKYTLPPRRRGTRPVALGNHEGGSGKTGLAQSVAMLKAIMKSGSHVHANLWHEIIRQLGMLGRMSTLRSLCIWLATHYGPQNRNMTEPWLRRYRVPAELSTSHVLHPLHVLFPSKLQQAIVEWGFIASRPQPSALSRSSRLATSDTFENSSSAMTSGIYILKKLNSLGVHIDSRGVRKAIFHRLITYYGPGYSNRRHNEIRKHTIDPLDDAAKQIDEALGGKYFTDVELHKIVHQLAVTRWRRRERAGMRRIAITSRDPRSCLMLGPGRQSSPLLDRRGEERNI